MKKHSIDIQKLLAGALLTFDRFDNLDLDILNEFLIKEKDTFVLGEDISSIDEFIDVEDGIVTLKYDLSLNNKIGEETLEEKLSTLAGKELLSFFETLDMEIFTLKKLRRIGTTPIDNISYILNYKQQETLEHLADENSVLLVWHENTLHGTHLDVKVSNYGAQRVFEYDHKEQLDEFIQKLEGEGLDTSLIGKYLRAQELSRPVKLILSTSNFKKFIEKNENSLIPDKGLYMRKTK